MLWVQSVHHRLHAKLLKVVLLLLGNDVMFALSQLKRSAHPGTSAGEAA